MSDKENIEIIITHTDEDTVIITSEQKASELIKNAFEKYDAKNSSYSTYLKLEDGTTSNISIDKIDNLGENAQSDINKILDINKIVRKYINTDDIIGRVYEAITANINTNIHLTYSEFNNNRNKSKKLEEAKKIIKNFNKQIKIKNYLRESIPTAYSEGNYISYLRKTDTGYTIMNFPLGIALVTDTYIDYEPVVIIDMQKLKSALEKTRIKTKKGKYMFFDSIEQEIKATYPSEVYDAYINKEAYAKLDVRYTGTIRVNNMSRKYGLSCIFKALKPTIMLDNFSKTDETCAKIKAKKIIHQTMNVEITGDNHEKQCLDETAYAHENLMQAWKQPIVVVTSPPSVKGIQYVEPKVEDISTDKIGLYRNKVLSALGIAFLASDKSTTASIANISLDQLMLTINSISEQIEDILTKWYALILQDYGYDFEFYPDVEIVDSEQMDYDIKQSLATMLFTTMGVSYETAFNILGLNVNDELTKRKNENDQKYDEIFMPRATAYTTTTTSKNSDGSDNKGGTPKENEDEDRKAVDKEYNDNKRV